MESRICQSKRDRRTQQAAPTSSFFLILGAASVNETRSKRRKRPRGGSNFRQSLDCSGYILFGFEIRFALASVYVHPHSHDAVEIVSASICIKLTPYLPLLLLWLVPSKANNLSALSLSLSLLLPAAFDAPLLFLFPRSLISSSFFDLMRASLPSFIHSPDGLVK